jgi:hypothetical protein
MERTSVKWTKPTLIGLNMSAEIGAYQEDFDRDDPRPLLDSTRAESTAEALRSSEACVTIARRHWPATAAKHPPTDG